MYTYTQMNRHMIVGDDSLYERELIPFSSASICSGVNDVRFRWSLRFKRNLASVSSLPSGCEESSVPLSGSIECTSGETGKIASDP